MDNSRLGVTETPIAESCVDNRGQGGGGQSQSRPQDKPELAKTGKDTGTMIPIQDKAMGGLLPDRHPTADFFVCDIFNASPKDDLGSMEHPIFSLATRPDRRELS